MIRRWRRDRKRFESWSWSRGTPGRARVMASVNPWYTVSRPRVSADWWDQNLLGISIEWGDGSSDPFWSVAVELLFSQRVADLVAKVVR